MAIIIDDDEESSLRINHEIWEEKARRKRETHNSDNEMTLVIDALDETAATSSCLLLART